MNMSRRMGHHLAATQSVFRQRYLGRPSPPDDDEPAHGMARRSVARAPRPGVTAGGRQPSWRSGPRTGPREGCHYRVAWSRKRPCQDQCAVDLCGGRASSASRPASGGGLRGSRSLAPSPPLSSSNSMTTFSQRGTQVPATGRCAVTIQTPGQVRPPRGGPSTCIVQFRGSLSRAGADGWHQAGYGLLPRISE